MKRAPHLDRFSLSIKDKDYHKLPIELMDDLTRSCLVGIHTQDGQHRFEFGRDAIQDINRHVIALMNLGCGFTIDSVPGVQP